MSSRDEKPKKASQDPHVTSRKLKRVGRTGGKPPAQTHGTQVRFHITCGRCGKDDVLSFVPKTVGDVLCQGCAEELFGPDWRHGRPEEARYEHTFTCARCGTEGRVPFKPDPKRELFCAACFRGEEAPRKDRLKGMRRIG